MNTGSMSGRGSMRRKQSSSLLQALGKGTAGHSRASTSPSLPPSAFTPPNSTSSHFSDASFGHSDPGSAHEAPSIRAPSFSLPLHSARSVSGLSVAGSTIASQGAKEVRTVLRRPEDVFRIVKDRVFSWSYLMQWYQGDVHWLDTIKVSRSAIEASLGPAKVEQRARHMFLLGTSLSPLFDITTAPEFLRSLVRLLDDWETAGEGGKGMMNLFRGQRSGKKGASYGTAYADGEYLLMHAPMPFAPDFFIAHSVLCSMIRDIYKKFLGMVLPPPTSSSRHSLPHSRPSVHRTPSSDPNTLFHRSTVIHSAPASAPNPLSPASITSVGQGTNGYPEGGSPGVDAIRQSIVMDAAFPDKSRATQTQQDGFQALIAGELGQDHVLVGDGQKLTPGVIDLFIKADTKLRKHYSVFLREGDTLARKVMEDEMASLSLSLVSGVPRFDQHVDMVPAQAAAT